MDFDAVVVAAAPAVSRPAAHSGRQFTNVFVKNFRDDVTDEQFQAAFAGCGKITSAVVARDEAGKSKRHGFVNFEAAEAALLCTQQFNGSSGLAAAGEVIDVVEHLKKSERFAPAVHAKPFHPKVVACPADPPICHSLTLCVRRLTMRLPAPQQPRATGALGTRRKRQRQRPSARRRKSLC
jgi:RNA recognition motif-containing protein